VFISFFLHLKSDFRYSSLSFVRLSWGRITGKLAINWQNFARDGLQLEFAFRIRPVDFEGKRSIVSPIVFSEENRRIVSPIIVLYFQNVLFNDFISIIIGDNGNLSKGRCLASAIILLEGDQSINVSPIVCCFNNMLCNHIHFIANSYRQS